MPADLQTSIAPLLSLRNGAAAVMFYQAAFGAVELHRVEDPTGAVLAQFSVAGAEFWISGESPEDGDFAPESPRDGSVRMILTVPDPDTLFAQAVAAGAQIVAPMGDAYGWHLGRIADPFGYHWEIGRPLDN